MKKRNEIVLEESANKNKKDKKPILNFKNDYYRLLSEFIIFTLIFSYFEIIASASLNYVVEYKYLIMFFITVCAIFLVINLIKNWIARFSVYTVLSVAFFALTILNIICLKYKHDGVSSSMIIVGLLVFIGAMFVVCFRNNRKKSMLYPRLIITSVVMYYVALPIYVNNLVPFGKMSYDKFFSAQNIGQLNYFMQDINCLINRELFEKHTVAYTAPSKKNVSKNTAYTGILEGKNVIQIMLEEEDYFFLNEKYTPNLYKLMTQGSYFSNFYSAFSYLSTYDAEFKTLTSAMGYTCNNYYLAYSNNTYSNSIANVLNNYNYKTIAMHNFRGEYFKRNKIWKNMGFSELYFIDSMPIYKELYPEHTDWYNGFPDVDFPLDSLMFETMKDYYAPVGLSQPFYSFILTIASHQEYKKHRNLYQKYYDILENDPLYNGYPQTYLTDMATIMDTDVGIGYMLEHLEENNMLDDTLIVIYTDHHSYNNEQDFSAFRDDLKTPYDIFKVPCMIYNPALPSGNNNLLTSQYDIVPTILDLLGIKYDTDIYYGQSMFDSNRDDRPIIFGAYKWINSKMYARNFTYTLLDTYYPMPNELYNETSQFVWKTIQKYNYFIYTDYFKKNNVTYIK